MANGHELDWLACLDAGSMGCELIEIAQWVDDAARMTREDLGLTPGEARLLLLLTKPDAPETPSQVALLIARSLATTLGLVDALVQKRMVRRHTAPASRAVRIELTMVGLGAVQALRSWSESGKLRLSNGSLNSASGGVSVSQRRARFE
jgi:DNA-binding MarR family transcriptional regulator